MGRHQTEVSHFRRKDGPRWSDPYYLEWAVVVGDRIRRLRRDRGWSLTELARRVRKPDGGHYSNGHFSRLERGWASAPLYVYIKIADAFEVDPGVLMGPDEVHLGTTAEQRVLLRVLDRSGIEPAEAIVRLSAPGAPG
jgi:transcriptional regulator with XRE-family HTH domain